MTDCTLPCFMFTCVPSGNVKLIPDIGSAASAKPSAPSAVTGRNIEPVVSEDGSSRSYLALFWDSRICLFASPTLSPPGLHPSCHAAMVYMDFPQEGGQADFRILVEPYKIFFPCPLVSFLCCHIIKDFDLAAKV